MTIRILAAIAVLAAPAPAAAQPSNQSGGGVFGVRPSTGLGSAVTVQGAEAGAAQQFARVDLNKNGQITRGEWGTASLYAPDFAKLDADHDGRVSLEEWTAKMGGAQGGRASRSR